MTFWALAKMFIWHYKTSSSYEGKLFKQVNSPPKVISNPTTQCIELIAMINPIIANINPKSIPNNFIN
jgi:hypothetical protein